MSGDPQWIQRLDALYGFALRLYPRSFRATWEQPMRQAFRDRCREIARGQRRPTALLTELLPDFALGLGRERIHDLGEGPMSKRSVLLALLVLLAATIALHDRIGAAGNATLDLWKQHRARVQAEAARQYWTDLARAMAPARTPRDATVAAVAWQMAGLARDGLRPQPDARVQAQAAFDAAIAGTDPAALWLAATDCPVLRCDRAGAVASLHRLDPDNAAVGLLVLAQAAAAGDATAKAQALQQLATARRYHSYDADLMASLLRVDRRARARGQFDADSLVLMAAMAWAQPQVLHLVDNCAPGAFEAARCRAIGRVLADGNSFLARVVGLKLWNRFATPGEDTLEVHRRIRNFHWMIANQLLEPGTAARQRWRRAWLEGDGEIAVMHATMAARGVPLEAPASMRLDPIYLDPRR